MLNKSSVCVDSPASAIPQIDYSVGFSTAEVEEIPSIQKAELKKTLAAYADNGSSLSRRRIDEIHAIIAACQRALQKPDPEGDVSFLFNLREDIGETNNLYEAFPWRNPG